MLIAGNSFANRQLLNFAKKSPLRTTPHPVVEVKK